MSRLKHRICIEERGPATGLPPGASRLRSRRATIDSGIRPASAARQSARTLRDLQVEGEERVGVTARRPWARTGWRANDRDRRDGPALEALGVGGWRGPDRPQPPPSRYREQRRRDPTLFSEQDRVGPSSGVRRHRFGTEAGATQLRRAGRTAAACVRPVPIRKCSMLLLRASSKTRAKEATVRSSGVATSPGIDAGGKREDRAAMRHAAELETAGAVAVDRVGTWKESVLGPATRRSTPRPPRQAVTLLGGWPGGLVGGLFDGLGLAGARGSISIALARPSLQGADRDRSASASR